jgi:hypothetical protein
MSRRLRCSITTNTYRRRNPQIRFLGKLEHFNELVELTNRDAENVGSARSTHHIDEPVSDQLLFLRVPLFPLPANVNPDAKTFLFGEGTVCDLDWNVTK